MKKHILAAAVLKALGGFSQKVLAAWAEFGPQLQYPGYKAAGEFSSFSNTKYIIVAHTGAYVANLATDPNSSTILGVMQNAPKSGHAMSIAYAGPSKVVAGGAVTAGAFITTNASGRATTIASGNMAIGRILETTANDGDIASALLFHPVRWSQVL